ncbi:MAG TPA: hypothetical protein PKN36_01815 [bacterium]|nr:hypothetical protein [bacterium]
MFALWIAWILILVFNSLLFSLFIWKKENKAFLFLSSLIFFYSQITGIFTLLGLIRLLHPFYITIAFLAISAFLLFYALVKKPVFSPLGKDPGTGFTFCSFYGIPFAIIAAAFFLNIYYRMPLPPFTTDGLLYHLPFAVEFSKAGSIRLVPLFFTDISMTYYPQGGSILYLFTLYSGMEYLYKFTQLPFMLMGAVSLYLLARENSFPEILCIALFCIFAAIKPVMKQSFLCYVDLIMAASFLSALYCFYSEKKKYLPLGILSASLLIATKNFVAIYLLLLIPLLFLEKKGRLSSKMLILSMVFFLFTGCFTYIRNLAATGNPFFPADISLMGYNLFKGIFLYGKETFLNGLRHLVKLFAEPVSDADPAKYLSLMLFSSLLVSLPLSFLKDKKLFLVFLMIPLSIIIYAVAIPPEYYQIRHLFHVYPLLSMSLVYPFKYLKKIIFAPFLLYGLFLTENLIFPQVIIQSIFLASVFFLAFFFPFRKKRYLPALILPSIFLLLLVSWNLLLTSDRYRNIKHEEWKMFYGKEAELWEFVQKNSGEPKNIAYVGEFLIYPFYGEKYRNSVFYQSVNSIETIHVHEYPMEKVAFSLEKAMQIYRKNPSYELWHEGLKTKKTDWVILKNGIPCIEKQWIEGNPEVFEKNFSADFADIYSFKPAILQSGS